MNPPASFALSYAETESREPEYEIPKERLVPLDTPLRLEEASPDEGDIEVVAEVAWPLLPDGEYTAKFVKQEVVTLRIFRGATRLFAHFQILDGPHSRQRIYGAWPVSATMANGKTRLSLKPRSDLYIMLCNLLGYRIRPDRISFQSLQRCVLRIRTRTVRKNFRQKTLPLFMQYSVVAEILSIEAGTV